MSNPVEEVGTVVRQVERESDVSDESSFSGVKTEEQFHDSFDTVMCSGIQETDGYNMPNIATPQNTGEKETEGRYVDLRHSRTDRKCVQVEDNDDIEKRGIQVTDSSDMDDITANFSDINTNGSFDVTSQTSDSQVKKETDEPNCADVNEFDFCEELSKDKGNKSNAGVNLEELLENEDSDSETEEDDNYESAEEGEANEDELKQLEEKMTEEEKEEKRNEARCCKEEGNKLFKDQSFKEAIRCYTRALHICPLSFPKDRAIMFSNRAVCKLKLDHKEDAIKDCTHALNLHPHYLKALLRRAELYEGEDKLDEALVDYQKVLELDPSQHSARAACMRLPDQIKERNEKMKEEMLGKLKDLGNMILKPFGLSTENFKLNQDPNTGGYSVNFAQNASKE
ncbi:tetratricopeptide repeat protein 1-like [Mizuhopecten yessoensis]|uniref:Tetratricopeptide repeat protein 1 n=1 Tax=Mizuhopecten yessoensis TaxID=6573 RepID=A0A210PX60_MIZYE|nr:tetratricopeptide repeat protein 1-like [Mizuhopecten yessoensis]OWF41049.1 Tetratricopeptide repeat protein 1 [Mizuhopecten yessoensis]